MRVEGHSNTPHPRQSHTINTGVTKAKQVAIGKLTPPAEGHKKMPPTDLSHTGNLKKIQNAFKRGIHK